MDLSTEYPKWKYHRTQPACTVENPEQEANLGDGWADHPSAFDAPEPEAAEPVAYSTAGQPDKPKRVSKAKK
jgi:hypothetical protein